MKNPKILILGSNGKTGRRVVEKLHQKNISVRKGSRKAAIPFDWEDENTWEKALEGIEKVYITFQPDLAVPGALQKIKKFTALATQLEVKKLILLSGRGEKEAQLCEQVLINSSLEWTIVRASWFNQNFSESFFLDPILSGVMALPKSNVPIPFVDADDIAEVVVAALLHSEHSNQVYELTGPEQLNFQQITTQIAEARGKSIQFVPVSMEDYIAAMRGLDLPEGYTWLIEYLFKEVVVDSNAAISNDIEKVLGRAPISFKSFAQQAASTGVWDA